MKQFPSNTRLLPLFKSPLKIQMVICSSSLSNPAEKGSEVSEPSNQLTAAKENKLVSLQNMGRQNKDLSGDSSPPTELGGEINNEPGGKLGGEINNELVGKLGGEVNNELFEGKDLVPCARIYSI